MLIDEELEALYSQCKVDHTRPRKNMSLLHLLTMEQNSIYTISRLTAHLTQPVNESDKICSITQPIALDKHKIKRDILHTITGRWEKQKEAKDGVAGNRTQNLLHSVMLSRSNAKKMSYH
jgi:hypothetical protein